MGISYAALSGLPGLELALGRMVAPGAEQSVGGTHRGCRAEGHRAMSHSCLLYCLCASAKADPLGLLWCGDGGRKVHPQADLAQILGVQPHLISFSVRLVVPAQHEPPLL